MPKYIYQCLECGHKYEIRHSFEENIDTCLQINEDSQCSVAARLERIPQHINYLTKQEKKIQVGQIVNDHIESTKQEIKEYKEEMINWSPKK
jgi:predicted nucleic acid-binding Zn ribbon protein|tara:strand:+ start:1773 stop:2048 length:276 start_codon:yes stop_codon:yes gene_type:complete